MIRQMSIGFDVHTQTQGVISHRVLNESLLDRGDPLQVSRSVFCRLPFRLRLGNRALFNVTGSHPARILVLNNVDIPQKQSQTTIPKPASETVASNLLVSLPPVSVDIKTRRTIKELLHTQKIAETRLIPSMCLDGEHLAVPVNRLLVCYSLFLKGVEWNRVIRLSRDSFQCGQVAFVHSFIARGHTVDYDEIERSLSDITLRSVIPSSMGGEFHDLPEGTIQDLQRSLNEYKGYYSLIAQGQDFLKRADFLNGLLYSVMALESAHSELIEYVITSRVKLPKADEMAENLLKQSGISALIKITPFLFIRSEFRPRAEVIEKVAKAITIRNSIAHAKRDSKGNPQVEKIRSPDVLPLIDAIIVYITAIAKELPAEAGDDFATTDFVI